jgi:hypothetical protein
MPEMQGQFNICKLMNVINHIKKLKYKSHMVISLDAEKALDNPTLLHDRSPGEIRDSRDVLPHNKISLQQVHGEHQLKWKETQSNSLKSGTRQNCPLPTYLFNVLLGLSWSNKTIEGNQEDTNWKGISQSIFIYRLYDNICK